MLTTYPHNRPAAGRGPITGGWPRIAAAWTVAVLTIALVIAEAGAAPPTPAGTVRNVMDRALAAFVSERARLKEDPDYGTRLIDTILVPSVDTRGAARFALGPHWRDASADQRQRFTEAFTEHTAATYGTIIHQYADELADLAKRLRVRYETVRRTDRRAIVRTFFGLARQPERAVDVYLHPDGAGGWEVFDVRFAGISLLVSFRADLAGRLQQTSLEALIEEMEHRNAGRSPSSPDSRPRSPTEPDASTRLEP